ncbi:hypothetical protein A2165_01330 [Candidatus Curtissbacteria bacterium RBG_13_40_7]|uniref:Uncharacterized protein n=1 Tax=Candidatus Curtissbacteria bacterium RBG_13_40_7 TaxID=1797706 RepID=A0A1F5FZM2_9BACT|nr:MAG: hypothetical protein A2165_01330 [Candidatus Curtissbacteria bacterium RBG_13_40_7]
MDKALLVVGTLAEAVACIIKEEDWENFKERLAYWNYWEEENWFTLERVIVENGIEYYTEGLPLETLERPPTDFQLDEGYQKFVVKMIEIAKEDRRTLEGQNGSPIESRPH